MVCNNISTLTNLQASREGHPVAGVAKTQGPTPKKKQRNAEKKKNKTKPTFGYLNQGKSSIVGISPFLKNNMGLKVPDKTAIDQFCHHAPPLQGHITRCDCHRVNAKTDHFRSSDGENTAIATV